MNDTWILDFDCSTFTYCCSNPFRRYIPAVNSQPFWESYEPTHGSEKPPPRYSHVSVTTGDRIIMFVSSRSLSMLIIILDLPCRFGGGGGGHFYNDTWSFDISTRKWTELQCTGSIPSPRAGHAAVLVDGIMYVFGGYTRGACWGDLIGLQLSSEWFNRSNHYLVHNFTRERQRSDGSNFTMWGTVHIEGRIMPWPLTGCMFSCLGEEDHPQ